MAGGSFSQFTQQRPMLGTSSMKSARKICVVTGSRADYGLLYWLMKELQDDPFMELQVAVTGMHLSPEFGLTVREIEHDGFPISACVEMLLSSDSAVGVAKSMGLGLIGFADVFERIQPDVVVLLGDRFEILVAAQAALPARIPVAHIHGGELTEGAMDESIRHALTKLCHIHFVAAESYRRRVIQLGEIPERVYLTGAPGLDHIGRTHLLSRDELERDLGISFGERIIIVTYHPVTLAAESAEGVFSALIEALKSFSDASIIITRPNADTHGRVINEMIDRFVESSPGRVWAFTSMGQLRYLSSMAVADVVIGNSSSGLTEAPLLKIPTVNIGARQGGRLRAPSVVDCDGDAESIRAAIECALSPEHLEVTAKGLSLYGYGDASKRIVEILRTVDLNNIVVKRFHNLQGEIL